jgi:hypothetical protein
MSQTSKTAEFLESRHPEYLARSADWDLYLRSFLGGRVYLDGRNLFSHRLEHPTDAARRLDRSYFLNHCRNVVELTTALLFAKGMSVDPPPPLYLVTDADRRRNDLAQVARRAATLSSIFGHVFLLVDVPRLGSDAPRTRRDELALGIRPYFELIPPTEVVNWETDEGGDLVWILSRERSGHSTVQNGVAVEGPETDREAYRLWTRDAWYLYAKHRGEWTLLDQGEHGLGIVPVSVVKHRDLDGRVCGASLLQDIAILNREIYNLSSLLQEILYRQTFGQLVAQGSADDYVGEDETLAKLGTSSIFLYPTGRDAPQYISPNAGNADLILRHIDDLAGEIYRLANLQMPAAEVGHPAESGVARAYRFIDTRGALRDKADALGDALERALWIASLWERNERDYAVTFPDPLDAGASPAGD